ncbi:hypothetical protein CBS101457_003082 [Exobasidium rhododendri]|nr:hypothetical protein CBS101457_003082 [Exobasidium rhododendri]
MTFVASALITGASSGLGYSTARFLAQQRPNWKIIIASRNSSKAAASLNDQLRKFDGRSTPNVFSHNVDCSSRQSVRQFAEEYSSLAHPPIKALLLNAGLQIVSGVRYSTDGDELTFATNHTGQALLFFLLRAHLAYDAHIIYTSSSLHNSKAGIPKYSSAELCAHPQKYVGWDTPNEGRRRYAVSKLANVLWLYALRRRVQAAGKRWTVAAFEPGFMPGTGLARDSPLPLRIVWLYILPHLLFLVRRIIPATYTPDQSGQILAKLAMNEGLVNTDDSTAYWKHTGPFSSSVESYNVEKQDDLWTWTVQQVSENETERKQFAELL